MQEKSGNGHQFRRRVAESRKKGRDWGKFPFISLTVVSRPPSGGG